MNGLDLETLAADQKECPSETTLDRYHLAEVTAPESEEIASHLQDCSRCQERMAFRQQGFDAHADLDPGALADRILSATRERRPGRFWLWTGLGTAMAAGLLFMIIWLQARPGPEKPTVRVKGGPVLSVFLNRDGQVSELSDGALCREGDRLRFRVDLPEEGHAMVVGVEQDGSLYAAYPAQASGSVVAKASTALELPGAARLDDSRGEEFLHLVLCPKAFSLDDLSPGVRGELKLPASCRSDSIRIRKGTE